MKKGFTLVELLAVIVILAIILAVAIPSVSGILSVATRNAFEEDSNLLIKAIDIKKASDSTFDPTDVTELTVENLLRIPDDNYSKLTVTTVDEKTTISVVGKGKWDGYTANGTYNNITVIKVVPDTTAPVITMIDDNPLTADACIPYEDPGATAADNVDGDLTAEIVADVSDVPIGNPAPTGTYHVTYTVTDSSNNTTTVTRTVILESVSTVCPFL